MKKLFSRRIIIILVSVCSLLWVSYHNSFRPDSSQQQAFSDFTKLETIKHAFDNQQSNLQVKQVGKVTKLLRDDNHGSRHQRFIIQLASGQKLLIAHNIDLAPKVESLKVGVDIVFYGEYEWNNKGGVIHWTHHDPKGKHPGGWLLYENRKYN